MTVACLRCKVRLSIPESRADNPQLKLKCPGCGLVFPLGKARRVNLTPTPAPQAPAGAPAPEAAAPAAPSPPPTPAAARAPAAQPAPAAAAPVSQPGEVPVAAAIAAGVAVAAPVSAAGVGADVPVAEAAPVDPGSAVDVGTAVPVSVPAAAGAEEAPAVGVWSPGAQAAPAATDAKWQICVNHSTAKAERVCPQCLTGYCTLCGQKVQQAVICPGCEVLCIRASEMEQRLVREQRRSKPLYAELGTILTYPFTDVMAAILLAVVFFFFTFPLRVIPIWGILPWMVGQGILMAYAFSTVERVSDGDVKLRVPPLQHAMDILGYFLRGFAIYIISWGPCILLLLSAGFGFLGGMGKSDPFTGAVVIVKLFGAFIGLIWALLYSPVAITVAALSHSFWETLKPWAGIGTIIRMGGTYWLVAGIFVGLKVGQIIISMVFASIPGFGFLLGPLIGAPLDVYVWLTVGCALGLAVDKKSAELGLD